MAKDVREYQLFTGSKEAYGQSYRYVDAHNVTASSTLARSRSSSPAGSSMPVRMGFSLGVAVRRPFSSRMS